jgi:hypothetical protein
MTEDQLIIHDILSTFGFTRNHANYLVLNLEDYIFESLANAWLIPHTYKAYEFDCSDVFLGHHFVDIDEEGYTQDKINIVLTGDKTLYCIEIIYKNMSGDKFIIELHENMQYNRSYFDYVNPMAKKAERVAKDITAELLRIATFFNYDLDLINNIQKNMFDKEFNDCRDYFEISDIYAYNNNKEFTLTTNAIYTGILHERTPISWDSNILKTQQMREIFQINFDKNFKIISFRIVLNLFNSSKNRNYHLRFDFDEKCDFVHASNSEYIDTQKKIIYFSNFVEEMKYSLNINFDNILIFELAFIFYLKLNITEEIKEILPELLTPSVYDFKSQDYLGRLELVKMLFY